MSPPRALPRTHDVEPETEEDDMIDLAHDLALKLNDMMASYPNLSQFHWDRIIQIAGADLPDLIGPEVK